MGEPKPPLRAAFWAISAALLLMLLATLSDPQRVRQSLIAGRATDRARAEVPAERDRGEVAIDDQMPIRQPMSVDFRSESPTAPKTAGRGEMLIPPGGHPSRSLTGGARTQVVTATGGNDQRTIARAVARPAMPILSPGALTGPKSDARFEELPPPPGAGADEASGFGTGSGDETVDLADELEPALQRLQLENELLSLRHDLSLSIESRQIEQFQTLQQQQTSLLERQQQTANRLDRLTQQIAAQSARLERLCLDQADSAATSQAQEAAGRVSESAFRGLMQDRAGDSRTSPSGEGGIEPSSGGRHRVSVVIESDDAAIFERLTHWSARSVADSPPPPTSRSAYISPRQRYLAPPPAHSDANPLTDPGLRSRPARREAAGPQPPLEGPPLAAPPARR